MFHQLVGETETTIRAEYTDTCNVSVRDAVRRLFLHLAENVSDDPALFVLGNVGKLRPGQGMVEIVSQCVVLGKVMQVAVLHTQQVIDL